MKHLSKLYNLALMLLFLTLSNAAFASRLEEAAARGQGIVISIGQITAVIGFIIGGTALSLGMAGVGKMILAGATIGAAATFGAPAMVDFLKDVFR